MAGSPDESGLEGPNASGDGGSSLELQRKILQIVDVYGPELLATPLEELRRMADTPCLGDNAGNVFGRIWDRFRFVPTAADLRKLGSGGRPDLPALIALIDEVWDPSKPEGRASVQDVA